MKKIIHCFWLALLFVVVGCAVKVPPVSTYVLTVPTAIVSGQPPRTHAVLLVSTMTADSGYKTSRLIYVKSPGHLQEYARHSWVAPPAQMLMPLVVERIEEKRYFRAVVIPPFAGLSDYRLETRLILLQQEFMQPVSEVRCIIQAVLINNKNDRVIASHRFQALIPAPGNNAESGVAAANQAARQISHEIADFVVANV
jgi:cholesterol transport system auxiliary component